MTRRTARRAPRQRRRAARSPTSRASRSATATIASGRPADRRHASCVPHAGDPFAHKVPAAAVVINGFGKSVGLLQVNELGVLETPIALTNTFSVGTVATAQIRAAIAAEPGHRAHDDVGESAGVRVQRRVPVRHAGAGGRGARITVTPWPTRGRTSRAASIGAGRGMSCFGLKGGIGTASRRVAIAGTRRSRWACSCSPTSAGSSA